MDRQHRLAAVDDHRILTIPDCFCLTSVIANSTEVSIVRLLDCPQTPPYLGAAVFFAGLRRDLPQ